jgi:hypothetical protein
VEEHKDVASSISMNKRPRSTQELIVKRNQQSMPESDEEYDPLTDVDYGESQLKNMAYSELQDESFDHMPQHLRIDANELQTGDLVSRIETAQNLGAEQQELLFNSLNIKEWEEAGEWFVEQFGQLMKKIVETRKAKRRVAEEIEKEIADRNTTVESMDKKTKDVLSEMKEQGREILQRRNQT